MSATFEASVKRYFPKVKDPVTGKVKARPVTVRKILVNEKPVIDSGQHKLVFTRRGVTLHTKPHRYEKNWKTMTQDFIVEDEYKRNPNYATMTQTEAREWLRKTLGEDRAIEAMMQIA